MLNARDPRLAALAVPGRELHRFGSPDGWDLAAGGGLALAGEGRLPAGEMPLRGEHNALNLCAALAALAALGAPEPPLPAALAGFEPLPHRLETVTESGGVTWVNDSISTTPESALAALASFPGRRVVLIAGGQDRGQEFDALGGALAERSATTEPAILIAVPSTGPRLLAAARAAGLPATRRA